jgi:glucan biosynthesis protein C
MGLFFFLSGYFTPASFERKGAGRFLKDRLLRLGIPLLVFMFVLNPIAAMGINYVPATLTGLTTPLTWQQYPKLVGIGPLWFVLMLLFFDIGYAIWRAVRGKRAAQPESEPGPPSYPTIVAFILALALSSYLICIVWPLGTYVLSFPTLAYLPQYLSFFVLGTIAFHRNWLRTIPASMGKVGLPWHWAPRSFSSPWRCSPAARTSWVGGTGNRRPTPCGTRPWRSGGPWR